MSLFRIQISIWPAFMLVALLGLFLSAGCKNKSGGAAGKAPEDSDFENIDWGPAISLDEIVTMAKAGRIREIQWHVMPNVIRIVTSNGSCFHFKNENQGVDLRKTLTDAGIKIGKGGIPFRHVF